MKINTSALLFSLLLLTLHQSCIKTKGGKGGSVLPDNGQVVGLAPSLRQGISKPLGMVYIPPGTFHMGPSDEDISYNFTTKNKQVSIQGFWMDAYEISNNKYRQYVQSVKNEITAKELGYGKTVNGVFVINEEKARTINYSSKSVMEKMSKYMYSPEDRIDGVAAFDPDKIRYKVSFYNLREAIKPENKGKPRSSFMVSFEEKVYPDTLVWLRDFSYSYNEPMAQRYFSHPAYGDYPVVGVSWRQAQAFCIWRTKLLNKFLNKKGFTSENDFRLPTEAEWEYAARGGLHQSMYPWGNYYTRNQKGCLLANFKPGRGNYAEDGAFYTARVDSYWPNGYNLYNMAGNVSEWTSSLFYEGSYNFQHDLNPDIPYYASETEPKTMQRKVVRGGSWKDISYFIQVSTRTFEYQDIAKSYIGFRCVLNLMPQTK